METTQNGEWRIGIDDTDSIEGGCTTHFAFTFLKKIKNKIQLTEYPLLIRLNPNVPWKTRGNGAVGIRFKATKKEALSIFEIIKSMLPPANEKLNRNSGAVLLHNSAITKEHLLFTEKAITTSIKIQDALELIKKSATDYIGKGNYRGLIGALAVASYEFKNDYTYELLLYRMPSNYGTPRKVEIETIKNLELNWSPKVFSNYDFETETPLILPRGKDPVLLGIRGESVMALKNAVKTLNILEPIQGGMIFKTNQATDDHFSRLNSTTLAPYNVYGATVKVTSKPERLVGGHVRFLAENVENNNQFWVVAYEPSKRLRKTVSQLLPNDLLWVGGGIRDETFEGKHTLNLEKIVVLRTLPEQKKKNPSCPVCGKSLTSKGKNQGYKCKKCNKNYPHLKPIIYYVKRNIRPGLHLPPLSAQRHLTKPLERYNYSKKPVKTPPPKINEILITPSFITIN